MNSPLSLAVMLSINGAYLKVEFSYNLSDRILQEIALLSSSFLSSLMLNKKVGTR